MAGKVENLLRTWAFFVFLVLLKKVEIYVGSWNYEECCGRGSRKHAVHHSFIHYSSKLTLHEKREGINQHGNAGKVLVSHQKFK